MDEILALQAALATAQDAKSSIKLSERNIVELVNKLKSLDLLESTLLYTLNGKEYTQDNVTVEINKFWYGSREGLDYRYPSLTEFQNVREIP